MVKKVKAKAKSGRAKPKAKRVVKKIKKLKSKVSKKSAVKGKKKIIPSEVLGLEKIGEVTHYFPHVNAAAVKILKNSLKVGDKVYIKGHTSDFKEKVNSIQLDHTTVSEGKKGQEIGLLVKSRVRIGDSVYKL